ncbi:hypothetical protein [Halorussus salinisoli]|uniref:hypothetical protein n=1 Tax=Halorussus salinisoli TaxID=2558242 RepID=UPI0010C1F5BB|nr:hypothetical protein [Halorussus salinisoli]
MPIIHFDEADGPERTQIGEALVKFARRTDRLETGRAEGKYFLNHEDGCDEGDEQIEAGEEFFFDTETGEVLCEEHGRARRNGRGK